jgi:hypothetical protein
MATHKRQRATLTLASVNSASDQIKIKENIVISILKRSRFVVWPIVGTFSVFLAAVVNAHHGGVTNQALYIAPNPDEPVEVEGTITDVFWRAPHIRYRMEDADGEIWELEASPSPTTFLRAGVAQEDFVQVGDFVRAAGFVSRRDSRALGLSNLLLPNGLEHVGGMAGASARWGEEWTADELAATEARMAEDRATADGIFRLWSIRQAPQPPLSAYQPYLSAQGRAIAETLDPGGNDASELQCQTGMPTAMFERSRILIEDQEDQVHIWIEQYNTHRYIYMNPETAPEPTYSNVGYSLGHWEGDDLIVNTSHIDHPISLEGSMPQSDQMAYLERFSTRENGEWLDYTFTMTDSIMLAEPVTLEMPRRWIPGVNLYEFDCVPEWQEG